MAHRTYTQIDQDAATAAAQVTQELEQTAPAAPEPRPNLEHGAEGEDVAKLVNLLAVLGYTTNDIIRGAPPVLDDSVVADVKAAQAALNVTEPEGELVGELTWQALYDAAEAKLASEHAVAASQPAATAGEPAGEWAKPSA